ncbi:hypothetical protein [Vacuolonema iberomarrocanum]|uniref:hypothetical protein n=1 Tax=Vacuolonema iberomarrocanum TaxID=3454632 RepID=UPI0019F4C55C|nr:hypothetical protein [filamentous cyanobacterium LEGE 07170]
MTPLHSSEQKDSQALTIEIRNSSKINAIAISFPKCMALRIVEEFFFSGGFEGDIRQLGNTLIVDNSPWIAKLKEASPTFDVCASPDAKHYLILTDDYTIEIISGSTPVIETLD